MSHSYAYVRFPIYTKKIFRMYTQTILRQDVRINYYTIKKTRSISNLLYQPENFAHALFFAQKNGLTIDFANLLDRSVFIPRYVSGGISKYGIERRM